MSTSLSVLEPHLCRPLQGLGSCLSLCGFRRPCFLVPSVPSGSYNLPTITSAEFPEPCWQGLIERDILLRPECCKLSQCLHIVQPCVSITVPIYHSLSDDGERPEVFRLQAEYPSDVLSSITRQLDANRKRFIVYTGVCGRFSSLS